MDHDRAEGEGIAPQEYTAIKIELLETEWTADMKKTLKKGSKAWGFLGFLWWKYPFKLPLIMGSVENYT